MKLKQLMALIVCAVVVGTVSVAAIAVAIFERSFTQDTLQGLECTAQGVETILDDWKLTIKGIADFTADRPDVQYAVRDSERDTIERVLVALSDAIDIELMAVTDADGRVLAGNVGVGTDVRGNGAVASALQGEGSYDYSPLGFAALAIVYAAPVMVDGSLVGTVIMAYDLSCGDFSDMMHECFDAECSLFYGDTIAETTTDMTVGSRFDDEAILRTVQERGDTHTGRYQIDGDWYLSVFMPLVGAEDRNRGMVFVAKSLASISTVRRRMLIVVVPYTGVVVSIFATIIFFTMLRLLRRDRSTGETLLSEAQGLVVSARENAATSQDQSAAVREIVATMEDNTQLSANISQKIKDVASVAGKTSGDVSGGVELLAANMRQLHEIADANVQTIDGIKRLGDKIENIWDIVTLINSVADQAKIIAFNAELEAAAAGEAGKNFHIVATEIRRLADGIIEGTKEIKERISEIQDSSDNLILASEGGTEKINAGVAGAQELSARFERIKNASEITADSAGDITTIIRQQAAASEQILQTLRQIATGAENFTQATEQISCAAEAIKTIAGNLSR